MIALINQGFTAQSAWSQVVIEHIRTFSRMDSEYLRERASDVRDLGRRVLEHLQQTARPTQRVYPEDTILIGEDLAAPHLAEVPSNASAASSRCAARTTRTWRSSAAPWASPR